MSKKKICGPLFPGVDYVPMEPQELKNFILDIQRFGFTPFRKMRLLQAVGPFCSAVAFAYVKKYGADYMEFSTAAWFAINKTIDHYDTAQQGGFLTLLAFWLRAEYNRVIYTYYSPKKYSADKLEISLISIYKQIFDDEKVLLVDMIQDPQSVTSLNRLEDRKKIESIVKNAGLNSCEKDFLEKFLNDDMPNLTEISIVADCSREYVRQVKNRTIKKLKKAVSNGKI